MVELFKFEYNTRWCCINLVKNTNLAKNSSSDARNSTKTCIIPFLKMQNSKMKSKLTKTFLNTPKVRFYFQKCLFFQMQALQKVYDISKN